MENKKIIKNYITKVALSPSTINKALSGRKNELDTLRNFKNWALKKKDPEVIDISRNLFKNLQGKTTLQQLNIAEKLQSSSTPLSRREQQIRQKLLSEVFK